MFQSYICSQGMVSGHGFTAFLFLMWSNALYLGLGKHHDPKSVWNQMKVVPLALTGAVSGGDGSSQPGARFLLMVTEGNHSPIWAMNSLVQGFSDCSPAKVSMSFAGGHMRVWKLFLYLQTAKLFYLYLPVLHKSPGNVQQREYIVSLWFQVWQTFPFGCLGVPDHSA